MMQSYRAIFGLISAVSSQVGITAELIDDVAFYKPQSLVEVEPGRSINLYCTGEGSPTVILEAGLGTPTAGWGFIQPAIAARTRVCSYDRAGIGFSDPGPHPSSVKNIVDDMERLFSNSEIQAPYVLVGHSYGGMVVRHFTDRHPESVVGLVLLDSTHEDQAKHVYDIRPFSRSFQVGFIEDLRTCANQADAGFEPGTELYDLCVYPPYPYYSEALNQSMNDAWLNKKPYKMALLSENEEVFHASADQLFAGRILHENLPLIVLSRDAFPKADFETKEQRVRLNAAHDLMQIDHASISTIGQHRIIPGAGHSFPVENPDVVIDAINEILDQVQ